MLAKIVRAVGLSVALAATAAYAQLPPPPPNPLSPSGRVPQYQTITYTWEAVYGASQYQVVAFCAANHSMRA